MGGLNPSRRARLAWLFPGASRGIGRRWAGSAPLRVAPLLLAALLLALPAGPAPAQAPNLAELRSVIAVRDAQGARKAEQTVASAQAYLAEFADGRYVDEVLLAMAQGQAALSHPELALQAYNRIVEQFKDSPFREQALAESLPLLSAQGDQGAAFARVDTLVEAYPNSLERSRALLWKAQAQYAQADHAGALATLKRVNVSDGLNAEQEADFCRLETLALVRSGESAWTPLQRYLKRDDSPERKAEVLMLVGEIARKADRADEALRFYQQVVEDYPVLAHLPEALFWRADLFAHTRLDNSPPEVRAARRETAIGYYAAYLEQGAPAHRAAALVGRARLQQEAGRLQPALADYDAATQLDGKLATDPELVRARVAALQGLGRTEEAVALLEAERKVPSLSPAERVAFQVQQAALHYDAKQCEPVEALLNPMPIVPDPQLRPRAFFMRGFCRYQRQEWEKATFDLEGLINDPNYQNLVLNPLLDAYEKSGQTSRLVNLAEELLKAGRAKPSAELLTRLATGYEKLGEPALMLSAYQRLEQAHPEAAKAPEIQLRMGLARERLGQRDAASANYRAVLQTPDAATAVPQEAYIAALEHLHALLLADGRLAEAEALLGPAAEVLAEPRAVARLAALKREQQVAQGQQALAAGKPKEAVARLEAALKQTPREPTAARARTVALLALARVRSGAGDKAAEQYKGEAKLDARVEAKPDGQAGARPPYRALLAGAFVAAVQAHPDVLKPAGKRQGLVAVYRLAFADLPADPPQRRYQAAQVLDGLYKEQGEHAARAALVTALLKDGFDDETQHTLRLYQGQIYTDWGQALLSKDDLDGATFQFGRALEILAEADWRRRFDVISLLSQVQLKRKAYGDLVVMNEGILPEIDDPQLLAQVRAFLGQVYVQWGKAAEAEDNPKSIRIRYQYALDYLPPSDWQRRLAATSGLAKALAAQGRDGDAAAAFEAVVPQIQDAAIKQQYALYLGKLYAERLKDAAKASAWFKAADHGDKEPLSLEAGYLWADQQLAAEHGDAALIRLKELAARGIAGTKWEVPIHYRIAVLLHQRKELAEALAHYRVVATIKGDAMRKLYPRSIEQSREQMRRIEAFLKAGGSQDDIVVPAVRPD